MMRNREKTKGKRGIKGKKGFIKDILRNKNLRESKTRPILPQFAKVSISSFKKIRVAGQNEMLANK